MGSSLLLVPPSKKGRTFHALGGPQGSRDVVSSILLKNVHGLIGLRGLRPNGDEDVPLAQVFFVRGHVIRRQPAAVQALREARGAQFGKGFAKRATDQHFHPVRIPMNRGFREQAHDALRTDDVGAVLFDRQQNGNIRQRKSHGIPLRNDALRFNKRRREAKKGNRHKTNRTMSGGGQTSGGSALGFAVHRWFGCIHTGRISPDFANGQRGRHRRTRGMNDFERQERRARSRLSWPAVVKAALIAGLIVFVLPGGGPWMSNEAGISTMGRLLANGVFLAAVYQVLFALVYGSLIAMAVYRLRHWAAIMTGPVLGFPLYGASYAIFRAFENPMTNETHALLAHLFFALLFTLLYRAIAVPTVAELEAHAHRHEHGQMPHGRS